MLTIEEQEKYLEMPITNVIRELNEKGFNDIQILEIFTYLLQTKQQLS